MLGWFNIDRDVQALEDFRRRMEQMFDEWDRGEPNGDTNGWRAVNGSWPRGNLYDTGTDLVLQVGVPGITQEDLKITGNNEVLTISGERKVETPEGFTAHRRERPPVRFCRTFSFPVKVDLEKTEANLKDGMLTVRVPKAPEVQPRTITVTAH